MKYKTMKVFDCQHMPEDIKDLFFDVTDHVSGNDVFIEWHTTDQKFADAEDRDKVDEWLCENGAEHGDEILVSRWW